MIDDKFILPELWVIHTDHNGCCAYVTELQCSKSYAEHICMLLQQARAHCVMYDLCTTEEWDKIVKNDYEKA